MVMDPVVLRDLRQEYQSGRLIVFVGAGVSVGAGLPSWKDLALRLRERVAASGAGGAVLNEMDAYIRDNQLLDAISAAKQALDFEFEREVREALDDKGRAVPAVAKAIAGLQDHLWAVLTTNLDRFIERAFEGAWHDLTSPPSILARENQYILKMHGTLRDASTWVFTRNQYDEIMFASPLLQDTFLALYLTHPILFVGFGLNDDNIERTLGRVRALGKGQPPAHYALFPEWEVGPARQSKLSASGIRLLKFSAYDEVPQVLQSLAGGAASPVAAPPAAPDGTPIPGSAGGPAASAVAPAPPVLAFTAAPPDAAPITAAPAGIPDLVVPAAAPAPVAAGARAGVVNVFISHAAQDHELLDRLMKQLSQLVKRGLISVWHPGMIGAGEEIEVEINAHLDAADFIIMLISADYLDSDWLEVERARAMQRYKNGAAKIVPVLLRPCMYSLDGDRQTFMGIRVYPRRPGADVPVPVVEWPNPEEAVLSIANEIRGHAMKARSSR